MSTGPTDDAAARGDAPRGTPAKRSERPSQRPGGPASLIGTILGGRYRIERILGEGGMGAVYQAEHTHMRKRLAVKVLHPEMSRLPEVVARFEREAMAAAHIDHPNVATATDFGKLEDGSFFLVLEYVEGRSLRDALNQGTFGLGRALHVVRQIAAALQRAHALGIVHRNLKPENVMLVEREGDKDFVKVLDFGIARVPVGELGTSKPGGLEQPVLTQLGMVYGTPEYMAPEQALGQPVDARADLYALGCMAYEMLTGHRPFDHESKVTLLGMQVTAPVPPMAVKAPDANVPPDVEAVVTKLLEKEATRRYDGAKELIDAIGVVASSLLSQGRITSLPMSVPMSGPVSSANISRPILPSVPSISGTPAPVSQEKAVAVPVSAPRTMPPPPLKLVLPGIAIGALALIGIVIFLVVGAVKSEESAGASASTSASTRSHSSAPTPLPAPDFTASAPSSSIRREPDMVKVLPDQATALTRAQGEIERGNFAMAVELLAGFSDASKSTEVHRLLETAYSGAKQPKEAMREALRWITADENAISDLRLDTDVRNAAIGKEGADEAFMLLETHMLTTGVDILWDIAFGESGRNYPQAAYRAQRLLTKNDVRSHATKQLLLALDLRDYGKGCEQKHALVLRAKDEADYRSLPPLKMLTATTGCGFLHRSDCWGCLRRDSALRDAVTAVESRSNR